MTTECQPEQINPTDQAFSIRSSAFTRLREHLHQAQQIGNAIQCVDAALQPVPSIRRSDQLHALETSVRELALLIK